METTTKDQTEEQKAPVTEVKTTDATQADAKKGKGKKEKGAGGPTEKELAKQKRLEERQIKVLKDAEYVKDPSDPCAHKFGDLELNRSQGNPEDRFTIKVTKIEDLVESRAGESVLVRARLHNSTAKGKLCFIVLRERFSTIQAVLAVNETTSKGMIEYARRIPKESIVDIKGKIIIPGQPKQGCSQKVEIEISEIWTVNKSAPMLPFQIEDASQKVENQEDEEKETKKTEESKGGETKHSIVGQDVRLNNRVIDLRVPSNQALFRLQSGVGMLFREFMYKNDFTEIHSPKLIGGSSEGGSNVFTLKYFDQEACLAQSPQLYKQMVICGDMQRCFEVGPVFRAEDSNTNRHLCEFTGLDMEMVIQTHYFEVLDMLSDMFIYIFQGLEAKFAKELNVVRDQYHFEPFKCQSPAIRLSFREGVALLAEHGMSQDPLEDLNTENEYALGRLVKEKYDTDFYMLYGYPVNARPFYTMLDPHDSNYTNSYDFFMRGEEITSGAQRIHDPTLLEERAKAKGIAVETIQGYIDSFKYGAPPHGGCGVGLERVVKLFCGIRNIRKCSLFPRDPKRLTP